MHYIYVIKSIKDNSLYIGLSNNLKKRLSEHNLGKSKFTKGHLPYKLLTYIAFSNRSIAANFEKYLKTASGKAFMKKRFLES